MKHTNKKGFTIVELVIVIAVIAILAAVLIPTFTNLVKKANQSADMQAARQMSTVLSAEPGIGNDIDKVIDLLVEAGYNAAESLKPITKDHAFYYFVDGEFIALVDTAKGEVVFPKDTTIPEDSALYFDLGNCGKYIDVVANDSATLAQAIAGGSEKITLTTDMTFTAPATVNAGSNVTIDLGGKNLVTGARDNVSHHYGLDVYGTVTLTNGTIDARGIQTYDGGKIVIGENVTVTAVDNNGGACVWNRVGTVTINGGTFTTAAGDWDGSLDTLGAEPGVLNNNGGTFVVNNGTFVCASACYTVNNNSGAMTINGGDFTGARGVIAAAGGTIEINGGTFATEEGAAAHVVYANDGHVVVNAGVVINGTYAIESDGTGSITFKAGVILNGETLANDLVIGTPVTE